MSVLPLTPNINQKTPFFLLANASTINANTINTNVLSTGTLIINDIDLNTLTVSTLTASQFVDATLVSSTVLNAGQAFLSSIFTEHIILDQATLEVIGGNTLLLNGVPIATTNTLSSLSEWAAFPAFSTVNMANQNLLNAGNITCQNITNALNVGTDSLSVTTNLTSPSGIITNLRTTNLSTTNLVTSNINGLALSNYRANQWATFPATSNVLMNGNNLVGGSNLSITTSNLTVAASNSLTMTTRDYTLTVDEGVNLLSPASLNLTAQNGTFGEINLVANGGFSNLINGVINLTANGAQLGGLGQGGSINLTANTPIGFSNLTSKISLNASGINSYAGVVPPLASAVGFNFLYGSAGVYIAAGLPPGLPNTPGTTYIYGTLGIEMPSDAYMKTIYPYFDGITTPPDLEIEGRVVNLQQVCVNLSNVRNLDFQSNVTTRITNVDSISLTPGSQITGLSNLQTTTINGLPYPPTPPVVSTFTNLFTSTMNLSSINTNSLGEGITIGQRSIRVQGNVAQLQCRNTTGQQGNLNLLMRSQFGEIQCFNSSFTVALPLELRASQIGLNTDPSLFLPGVSVDISGNTNIRGGDLTVSSINGTTVFPPIFGQFLCSTTTTVSGANTPTVVNFESVVGSGVSLDTGRILIPSAGTYFLTLNTQLSKGGGGGTSVDVFVRRTAGFTNDVVDTTRRFDLDPSTTDNVSCSFLLPCLSNDLLSFVFASADAGVQVAATPAQTSPYIKPATPAITATITKV